MKTQFVKKSILMFLIGTLFHNSIKSQERTWLLHGMLYKAGRFEHRVESDTSVASYKTRMGHPTFEFAFTDELYYIHFAAFAPVVAGLLPGKVTVSPALDFAWGWHLNRRRPIKLGGNANVLLGMGFNMGLYAARTFPPQNKINATPAYIGPTMSANLQIGERFNVQNTIRINLSKEGRTQQMSGSGSSLDMLVSYKLSDQFGISIAPVFSGYSYKKDKKTNVDYEYKYITRNIQLGICYSLD